MLKRNVGLLLRLRLWLPSLSLPMIPRAYHECALALYINGTGNNDCPILEPANSCDATIGNGFPESDASLEITGLKCYILTQN